MGEFEIGRCDSTSTILCFFARALKMRVERDEFAARCATLTSKRRVRAWRPKRQQVAVMCVTLSIRRELRRGKNFGESSLHAWDAAASAYIPSCYCASSTKSSSSIWHNGHHLAERITFASAMCTTREQDLSLRAHFLLSLLFDTNFAVFLVTKCYQDQIPIRQKRLTYKYNF